MEPVWNHLLDLCRQEVFGTSAAASSVTLDEADAAALYRLAKAQDLGHLCGAALEGSGVTLAPEIAAKFGKQTMLAVYRHERTQYEYARICDCLEGAKIPFLPLKGSLIRAYYPEAWMRTSCDIDVLVHEEDLDRAVKCLCEETGFRAGEKDYHDISLYSESGIHLELHFSIKENVERLDGVLSRVWEYARVAEGKRYAHVMTEEYLVFHTVAHMAHHFLRGGCGVRPFIDLWLLRQKLSYDDGAVRALCAACGIEPFYGHALALCEVWFGDGTHTATTERMERYLLEGGIYGTVENRVSVARSAHKSKLSYVWRRIFVPLCDMKAVHPVLAKHPYLLPFFWVRRWWRALFGGKVKKSVRELRHVQRGDTAQNDDMARFLDELGLKQ